MVASIYRSQVQRDPPVEYFDMSVLGRRYQVSHPVVHDTECCTAIVVGNDSIELDVVVVAMTRSSKRRHMWRHAKAGPNVMVWFTKMARLRLGSFREGF